MGTELPIVAIVGRPNVGKSTLFNRIVGGRSAIAHDQAGVTRDRRYGEASWNGRDFRVIDTGGLHPGAAGVAARVHDQARLAVDEADIVLFVVDVQEGVTPVDFEVADLLRRSGRPVIHLANKIDAEKHETLQAEVYQLGGDEVHPVSAAHGRGVGDVLDRLVALLPGPASDEPEVPSEHVGGGAEAGRDTGRGAGREASDDKGTAGDVVVRLAFVGRPNVGKSSLVNRILGEERVIVDEVPGTTRDPIDTPFEHQGRRFVLCDTAGIRRRARVREPVERVAALMAERAAAQADVCILVIDGLEGPTDQDARLASHLERLGRALVIALSKSDRWRPGDDRRLRRLVREQLGFVSWAPLRLTSARTGQGVPELLATTSQVWRAHRRRVPTAAINRVLEGILERHPPPVDHGRQVKIYYMTQADVAPPAFVLNASRPAALGEAYRRYLAREIRQSFDFRGTPIRIRVHGRRGAARRRGSA